MAPEPSDDVLELGCGHGVAASLICERLNDGRLTAIDRSARMIALAARRNAEHVAAGRARFEAVAVEKAELGEDAFDKLFAVDVAAFWRPGTGALTAARRLLRPGGTLHPPTTPRDGAIGRRPPPSSPPSPPRSPRVDSPSRP